ncbi:MAG TPA: isochorismatase family protein, partial [Armatimonadota bacterium]|nr:isochorismatase family protein [Armatimonadota bacterium]
MLLPTLVAIVAAGAPAQQPEVTHLTPEDVRHGELTAEHYKDAVLISVDLQEIPHVTVREEHVPESHRAQGVDAADVNAANDYLFESAMPNAARIVKHCRALGMPVVLVHWGYRFKDAMDLDPVTRAVFLEQFGEDWERWPHHIDHPTSRPAEVLDPQPTDYIIAKTAQDAFTSSNIDFVLKNLG